MTLAEFCAKHDIAYAPGSNLFNTRCPRCSHLRKKKRKPCLRVEETVMSIYLRCFNCGWHVREVKSREIGRLDAPSEF